MSVKRHIAEVKGCCEETVGNFKTRMEKSTRRNDYIRNVEAFSEAEKRAHTERA